MSATEAAIDARRSAPARIKRPRSAVSSGRKLFAEGDPNSAWSRRYHDLIVAHVADLGGADVLSEAQKGLIRRAAAITCELEQMEGRLSMGQQVDLDIFTRSASHLRRIHETLGIERKQRDITPSLTEYAEEVRRRAQDAPEAQRGPNP